MHRLRQGQPAPGADRSYDLAGLRGGARAARADRQPVRRVPRDAGFGLQDLPGAFRQQQVLGCLDRKSTRLNSSHGYISYAVFCLKKKKIKQKPSSYKKKKKKKNKDK